MAVIDLLGRKQLFYKFASKEGTLINPAQVHGQAARERLQQRRRLVGDPDKLCASELAGITYRLPPTAPTTWPSIRCICGRRLRATKCYTDPLPATLRPASLWQFLLPERGRPGRVAERVTYSRAILL